MMMKGSQNNIIISIQPVEVLHYLSLVYCCPPLKHIKQLVVQFYGNHFPILVFHRGADSSFMNFYSSAVFQDPLSFRFFRNSQIDLAFRVRTSNLIRNCGVMKSYQCFRQMQFFKQKDDPHCSLEVYLTRQKFLIKVFHDKSVSY